MRKFIASLGNNSGTSTIPELPIVINPADISNKIYWWIDDVDQIGSLNLINQIDLVSIPYTVDTKKATEIISLNSWFNSNIPIQIQRSNIATYCASRQFYNATTKELIIVKNDKHLTATEEIGLLNYMSITNTQHTYSSNTDSLFSRFTNTYDNKEKSKLDNVMRLLVSSGIYNKLDHFYLCATSKKQEQLLDWKNPANNITKVVEDADMVAYRGLAPQTGYFSTNSNPSTDTNIAVDNAFVSIKTYQDFEFNAPNYLFGAIGNTDFRYRPVIAGSNSTKQYEMKFFTSSPIYFQLGTSKYSDTNVMTKINGSFKSYRNGVLKHTVGTAGTTTFLNANVVIGGIIGIANQSQPSNIQHLAWGSGLTDAEGTFLSTIIDNFCYGQKAIELPYVQENGYKLFTYEFDIKDALGEKCIYQKTDGIYFSEDLGKTYSKFIAFPYIALGNIEMCHIFDDGKIIFATHKNKVYKTTWDLLSYEEIIPTKNGVVYPIHTPVSPFYPGEYFKYLGAKNKQYLNDGREIFVWGNYCNVFNGASPTVIWYSFGNEIKVAYEYAQNPYYTDTGTFISGPGGTLLGSTTSTIRTRHSHGVQQASDNKNLFFALQGDYDRAARTDVNGTFAAFFESGFVRLDFNEIQESFNATLQFSGTGNSRAKSTAVQMPGDGYLYYSSDLSVTDPIAQAGELGYFKVRYADVPDLTKHERFHLQEHLSRSLNHFHLDSDYFFMGGGYAAGGQASGLFGGANIIFSHDMVTYFEKVVPIPGNLYFYKITKISHKKYLLNAMVTYNYRDAVSVVLDFN